MKTKNILKIGALSIILLSLLISPILKLNSLKVKADTPDTATAEFCKKYSTMNLPDYAKDQGISEVAAKAEYVERCCNPVYDWGDDQKAQKQQDAKCKTLSGGVDQFAAMGATTEVTGTAKELSASKVCNLLVYGEEDGSASSTLQHAWAILTDSEDDTWWAHKACIFQIGALEGMGKMIAGMINSLSVQITWALDPTTYGGFVTNVGVVKIWNILRNFMNLALVLILIIIAISTILGIKKYRWQEILWKLVLIALLINFSLILPGVLLDISHFITFTFINLTQNLNNDESIAQTIMDLYRTDEISGPEKYSANYGDTLGEITVDGGDPIKMEKEGWGLAWGNFFLVLAALSLIGLFAFISLIAIFFTIMFRSFIIIMLLAVSPIAFAAWVLPNTEKFWQLWWGQFTRWCLFPITFAISLYAGIVVLTAMHDVLSKMGTSNDKLGIIAMIVQIILFSMFLIGGLVVSIQSGGVVAKTVQKQVSRAGWLAGVFASKKIVTGVQKTQGYRNIGQKLTHVPLISSIGHGMLDKSDSFQVANDIKKYEKEMEASRDKDSIMDTVNRKAPSRLNKGSYARYMAARNIALKKGWLNSKETPVAINEIKNDVLNENSDLDTTIIRNALPQYFEIVNGELKKLDQKANDYQDKVINNLNKIKLTDLPKNTEKIVSNVVNDVGGDIDEFFEKLARLKSNKFRAFLDNVSDKEYGTGEVFGGTTKNPKPWYGRYGEVGQRLNQRVADTSKAYEDVTDSKGNPIGSYTQSDVDVLENKWIAAQAALDKINKTLSTSSSLQETLETKSV